MPTKLSYFIRQIVEVLFYALSENLTACRNCLSWQESWQNRL